MYDGAPPTSLSLLECLAGIPGCGWRDATADCPTLGDDGGVHTVSYREYAPYGVFDAAERTDDRPVHDTPVVCYHGVCRWRCVADVGGAG